MRKFTSVIFHHSMKLKRERIPRLRYLLPLHEAQKGAHTALPLPFTTPCTTKGSAYLACVTFYHSMKLKRERIPRLRYLSSLTAPPKGAHTSLALPFITHCTTKGSAYLACVTFCHSLHHQRERIPRLRYLSPLTAPPKGAHTSLALPFTTHCTTKGSAYCACVTFYHSLKPKRECIPRLRYLLPLTATPKGVHPPLALPFTTHCDPKGSASPACVTFYHSLRPQRECIPRLRYLLPLHEAQKGAHSPLVLPFTTHGNPKGSAYLACVTFYHSLHHQRERIPRLRYLLPLTAPPKGAHSPLALPFATP